MPDVYAPAGAIVEPPLRRERLRSILGIGTARGDVARARWAATGSASSASREAAFSPLLGVGRVRHPRERAGAASRGCARRCSTSRRSCRRGLEWASSRADDQDDDEEAPRSAGRSGATAKPLRRRRGRRRRSRRRPVPQPAEPSADKAKTTRPIDGRCRSTPSSPRSRPSSSALDAPGDAPERSCCSSGSAKGYARLGAPPRCRPVLRARGVGGAGEAQARLDAWIAADLAGRETRGTALDHALATNPNPGRRRPPRRGVRRARAPAVARDPHRVQRWLDDHDGELDARSLWLARSGLARLAGGDHARPRARARSHPRAARRRPAGRARAAGVPALRRTQRRARQRERRAARRRARGSRASRIAKTKRKRSPVEAPAALHATRTSRFQLAHGFARIGNHDERARARRRSDRRRSTAVATDAVHAYLIAAFTARVEQAIAGMPPETPLGRRIGARARRARSRRALQGRPPARGLADPRAARAHRRDRRVLASAEGRARPRVRRAARARRSPRRAPRRSTRSSKPRERADDAERERLLDGVLDVLLELPEAQRGADPRCAWPLIERRSEASARVLYAEALVVAGHFGRTELVPRAARAARPARSARSPAPISSACSSRACARCAASACATRSPSCSRRPRRRSRPTRADALRGRLALAAGLAYLGDSARALPIFEQARKALTASMTMTRELELTRALALAYSQAPLANALAGIAELADQLKDITDSFGTNSHYCLSRAELRRVARPRHHVR